MKCPNWIIIMSLLFFATGCGGSADDQPGDPTGGDETQVSPDEATSERELSE